MSSKRGKLISDAEFRRWWADETMCIGDMAARLGVSLHAVSCRAKARGLPARPRTRQLKISDTAEFTAMWNAGVQTRDIMEHFGCSHLTPRNTAARLGLKPRGWGWYSPVRLADYLRDKEAAAMAAAMAASAAETRAVMKLCEMTDHPSIFNKRAA